MRGNEDLQLTEGRQRQDLIHFASLLEAVRSSKHKARDNRFSSGTFIKIHIIL